MPMQELLTALTVAAVIAPIWKFFLQRRPLSAQQRLVIQTASKELPQADSLLLRGYATRHQYRQVLIALARAHRHS